LKSSLIFREWLAAAAKNRVWGEFTVYSLGYNVLRHYILARCFGAFFSQPMGPLGSRAANAQCRVTGFSAKRPSWYDKNRANICVIVLSLSRLMQSAIRGDVVQLVRMLPCHGRGRGFEPRRPRHKLKKCKGLWHSDNMSFTP
jgi:hypothetical protein